MESFGSLQQFFKKLRISRFVPAPPEEYRESEILDRHLDEIVRNASPDPFTLALSQRDRRGERIRNVPAFVSADRMVYYFRAARWGDGRFFLRVDREYPRLRPVGFEYELLELCAALGPLPEPFRIPPILLLPAR